MKRMPWQTELPQGREVWVRQDDQEYPGAHGVIVGQPTTYDWFIIRLDDGTEIERGSTGLKIEANL